MKTIIAVVSVGILAATAHATDQDLEGLWVLTPGTQQRVGPACAMTLEFTADDRVVRTTGQLTYTSTAVVTAEGSGWLLKEKLESQNGMPGCGGKSAEEIVSHFQREAYVEMHGTVLRYYGVKGTKRALEFERADARQSVPAESAGPADGGLERHGN